MWISFIRDDVDTVHTHPQEIHFSDKKKEKEEKKKLQQLQICADISKTSCAKTYDGNFKIKKRVFNLQNYCLITHQLC
jgi:hypothetical protein